MKEISRSGWLLLLMATFLVNTTCFTQVSEVGNLMAGGTEDAKVLLQPYITPVVNAFGAALGGGWYNTAEPHKLGGFDITITGNVAIIPKKFETFEIDNSRLSVLQVNEAASAETPTIAGDKVSGPQIDYSIAGYTQPAFHMPRGMNSNYMPAPMIQAGIGLIKGTEVIVRYLPNFKISDNEAGLWGIGGKHDIKQWIPGLNRLPVLQMSIMYGYTKLHTYVAVAVEPDDIGAGSLPDNNNTNWDNQELKIVSSSQTANLILSANLPVVCFYGAVGLVKTKTNLKLEGEYPVVQLEGSVPVVGAILDPVDMEIRNQDGGVTKPRLNAGIRFKLAVVTIHFDYSWANYSVLTGGLGISFR